MDATELDTWRNLHQHQAEVAKLQMRHLFEDSTRSGLMTLRAAGLTLDYSRNLVIPRTLTLLHELASKAGFVRARDEMLGGERVNVSEDRAALHTLLRNAHSSDHDAAGEVRKTLDRMRAMANAIRSGEWKGATGQPIKHVIHIGVGGSYLGPRMASEALTLFRTGGIDDHYVANIDGHHVDHVLSQLPPAQTLVVIVSKTFTTLETCTNAETVRSWLAQAMPGANLAQHFIAVSTNLSGAGEFGVKSENVLPLWDFVGGRYSLWSAVGLTLAITHGFEVFERLLDGARAMDKHFASAAPETNLPLTAALLSVWYNNFFGAQSHAVVPYDHFLRLLPAHLQQLDMESLGKSVNKAGVPVTTDTGQIIWGGEGSNGQHAFHQLLHQGTRLVPVDFILPLRARHHLPEHHEWLVANCLGQAEALMLGLSADDLRKSGAADSEVAHRTHVGNRPSNVILVEEITPEAVGALVAFYEHKVFCQAVIWQVNPFDQWGVEYGKLLSRNIYSRIKGEATTQHASTEYLINLYQSAQTRE